MCLRLQEAWKDPAKREPMIASIPLGKFAEPEDISDAVLFLLSERAVS
jgi:NAD(P)-dependent dehydrogenase (short-subunit alcohol dehydrogenase family)